VTSGASEFSHGGTEARREREATTKRNAPLPSARRMPESDYLDFDYLDFDYLDFDYLDFRGRGDGFVTAPRDQVLVSAPLFLCASVPP
jgi:hypothetical protein